MHIKLGIDDERQFKQNFKRAIIPITILSLLNWTAIGVLYLLYPSQILFFLVVGAFLNLLYLHFPLIIQKKAIKACPNPLPKNISANIEEIKALLLESDKNSKFYHTIFESFTDGISVLGPDLTIIYTNHAMKARFGNQKPLEGRKCYQCYHGATAPCLRCPSLKSLKSGQIEYEIHKGSKESGIEWIKLTAYPIRNPKTQSIIGVVEYVSDVSEQYRAEDKLRQAKTELEQVNLDLDNARKKAENASQAKSRFLASISHEIRTSMNAVIGMTTLLSDMNLNQEERQYLDVIRNSGNSLLAIINEILDFTKIESGTLDIESKPFDLWTAIEKTAQALSFQAHEKRLEFNIHINGQTPKTMIGDINRFKQILTNLIANAIKFTHEGEIFINTQRTLGPRGEPWVHVSISDTGIGLNKAIIPKLFQPFEHLHDSKHPKVGGTGLGLAICKKLVECMDGVIGYTKRPERGTEFWFSLPTKAEENEEIPMISPLPELSGIRLLIIGGQPHGLMGLLALLEPYQLHVTTVYSAKQAMKSLKSAAKQNTPFQIVFIYKHLPDINGIDLGRAINNLKNIPDVQMVILTPFGSREDVRLFHSAGFKYYLFTPVLQATLLDVFQKSLVAQNLPDQTDASVATGSEQGGKKRILVVEDNPINQKVAVNLCKKFGYFVKTASNGEQALAALEKEEFDLVLMDCQLPIMDGFEATEAIRSRGSNVSNRNIPIVAMTAYAMKGDREKCLESGMDDYIAKPIEGTILNATIEKWLSQE